MRLADLINTNVFAPDGTRMGRVRDVRLIQTTGMSDEHHGPFRVDGILYSRHALGARLGMLRDDVHGPQLIQLIERSLQRHARFALWEDIASIDQTAVHLARVSDPGR